MTTLTYPRVLPTVDLRPAVRIVSAVCPWCEVPRRTDKGGYFHTHRSHRVKGRLRDGRPKVYVAVDECLGSGERPGETRAWDET